MPEKICGLCGEDCSARPRTKDKRGRYYCTACYETAVARRRAERVQQEQDTLRREREALLGDTDAPGLGIDPGLISDLLPAAPAAPVAAAAPVAGVSAPAVVPRSACGKCGALIESTAVVCIACGTSVATPQTTPDKRMPARSTWLTAPFDLFLRPYAFHGRWTMQMPGLLFGLLVVLGWTGNLVSVYIRRIEWHPKMQAPVLQEATWLVVWAMCGVGAIVVMPIIATLLLWPLYWIRVRLAGEPKPGFWRTMRVMLISQLTLTLPIAGAMAYVAYSATSAKTADEELPDAFRIIGLAVTVLSLLSIWVSFWGVRAVFDTKRWRAVLLFLVLPWMMYLGGMALVWVFGAFVDAMNEPQSTQGSPTSVFEPDRPANSFRFERDAIRFYYPRTWRYEQNPPEELPSQELWFESTRHDVTVQVVVVPSSESPGAHLDSILAVFNRDSGQDVQGETRFTEQGAHTGAGAIVDFLAAESGQRAALRAFVTEIRPGLLLEMQEMYTLEDEVKERVGLEMVRETLVFVE